MLSFNGQGIDEPVSMTRGGSTYFYTMDGLGSVKDLTDSTQTLVEQYDYDSFGNLTTPPTTGNPYTYTSREYDPETGLLFYRARYYDPKVGRFLQQDPKGFDGGDVNFFAYVAGNPINAVDPMGRYAESGSDYISWQLSLYFFSTEPGFWSGASLAWDSYALVAPPWLGGVGFGGYAQLSGKTGSQTCKMISAGKRLKDTGKIKTVIGHYEDVLKYKDKPGYRILDDPRWEQLKTKPLEWWYKVNKSYIDEAEEIFFATDPNKARAGSWFEAELEYIGYFGR